MSLWGTLLQKPELFVFFLWLFAIIATEQVVGYNETFLSLAPIYFVCMVGCIIVVKIVKRVPRRTN
ncbi:MAG: hypothetical protein D6737_14360 [Chloroflexi bacterium]|nr:MAG: hypothetical protein D6737_14360 [Chloroflexota bacterium]